VVPTFGAVHLGERINPLSPGSPFRHSSLFARFWCTGWMVMNSDPSVSHKARARVPFCERPTCSVDEASAASGLSRSLLYEKMKEGKLDWIKVDTRRLVKVPSLLRLLGGE
jgi:hypothetical protein